MYSWREACAYMVLAWIVVAVGSVFAAQNSPPVLAETCKEWHDCQRMALDAYERRDYERFHDLAWRTMQTGPARDPDLMYLLARAQSLSGRPHDALVMLGRLAEAGFAADAATDDDFRAVRQLRQWPEFLAALTATTNVPAKVLPAEVLPANVLPADVLPSALTGLADAAPVVPEAPHAEEALRIPGVMLGSVGLAYDRVASRFVVADAGLRKLMIIDERSHHVIDLVRSASAGFYDITGFEIDPFRGDLWVVSAEPAATSEGRTAASALHKLQLVSGRPLDRFPVPTDLQPCRFADVAVTREGTVLVLDAAGSRLLRFRPRARTFSPVAALDLQSPTSVATAGDHSAYVAHAAGIARVDTVTGRVESLSNSDDVRLIGFDRIRWARDSLIGIQRSPDGTRRVVRIKIVDRRAVAMDVFETDPLAAEAPLATVSDDELYFLVHQTDGDPGDVVIRRSRMR